VLNGAAVTDITTAPSTSMTGAEMVAIWWPALAASSAAMPVDEAWRSVELLTDEVLPALAADRDHAT